MSLDETKWWQTWKKKMESTHEIAIHLWDETEIEGLLSSPDAAAIRSTYLPTTGPPAALADRMVLEHRQAYPSDWAAVTSIAAKIGVHRETLWTWMRRAQQVGGVSAADLLRRLGERVQLIHVKDGAVTHDDQDQVSNGSGKVDILAAAPQALRVVELDGFSGDVFDALRDTFAYLTANGVSA